MDYSAEEWKDIPGFNGRYQASTSGRIKAVGHPRRINHTFVMKPQPRGAGGYLGIGLYDPVTRKQRYHFVHLLILATFVGPCPPGMQGNHIDFDKHHNALANLEYSTPSGNTQHALRAGRKKSTGRGRCLTPAEVREIRRIVSTIPQRELSNVALARRYDTSHETIRQIRLGKRWRCLDDA